MSDVPSEIRREILLRLPAESLLRFRAVCKEWRLAIDDPSFVKSHTGLNKFSPSTLLLRTVDGGHIYSLHMDSLNFTSNGERTIDVTLLDCLVFQGGPRPPRFPVSSCNGLILVLSFLCDKTWAVWNPLTHEYHELPRPEPGSIELTACGLGFDSGSDDYKVVRIDHVVTAGRTSVRRTLIYSLRSNSWKRAMDCPHYIHWASDGVFFKGALHWRSVHHLVCFDLATEDFYRVALPPSRTLPLEPRLDVLGGCLVLSDSVKAECAWMMKDSCANKKKRAWRKLFSSRERSVIGKSSGLLCPVAYSKTQRELILRKDNKILMWDIRNNFAKQVTINVPLDFESSQIFPGSLFRFKDVVGGGGGGQISSERNRRQNGRTRMRWSVTTSDFECLSDSDCSSYESGRESDQSGSGSEDSARIETDTEDDETYYYGSSTENEDEEQFPMLGE